MKLEPCTCSTSPCTFSLASAAGAKIGDFTDDKGRHHALTVGGELRGSVLVAPSNAEDKRCSAEAKRRKPSQDRRERKLAAKMLAQLQEKLDDEGLTAREREDFDALTAALN